MILSLLYQKIRMVLHNNASSIVLHFFKRVKENFFFFSWDFSSMCSLGTVPDLHILGNSKGRMGVLPLHVFWKILSSTGMGREPASGHCRELPSGKTFSHKLCTSDCTFRLLYCQYSFCKINNMQLRVSSWSCSPSVKYSDSLRNKSAG